MSQSHEPTKLSESIDNANETKVAPEATIDPHLTRPATPETIQAGAAEATIASEGSGPIGPQLEATLAFATGEAPPGAPETILQSHLKAADSSETVAVPQWAAATEIVTKMQRPGDFETIDVDRANQTTEFVDQSELAKARRSGALRGAPTLPGYTILAEIGRGGMGVVYKAWHNRLDRPVALKMILSGAHASDEQVERFQIEAKAIAQIQYPGIVQIYDIGEHDGLPFFSLEFVSGGSLDKKLARKPQPPEEAALMVRKLALAINQAHALEIIHRDLKPANVLLTPEGEPKITDFGLAKRLEGDSQQTRSGAIMGTPSYMSPEQAWGQTQEIGKPTDQYALGTILYEMLVGHVPFQGATALETLELARTQEPIPPTRLQPKIPVDLETICLKCLQKEVSKRYPDVKTLADELDRFLHHQPIQARPIGKAERTVRWCRRNPRVAGLLATVAALLVIGVTGLVAAAVILNAKNVELVKSNESETAAKNDAQLKEKLALAAEKKAEEAQKEEAKARVKAEKEEALAVAARTEAEKAKAKEAEERIKAEEAADKFRKIAKAATNQNRDTIENLRNTSLLINQRLRQFEGTNAVRKELVDVSIINVERYLTVMKSLQGILEDRDGEMKSKKTMAGLNLQAARLMVEYERYDKAIEYYEQVDAIAESLVASFPGEIEALIVLAVSKGNLGGFQLDQLGNAQAGLQLFERTLEIRRQILERQPNDEESKRGVANALGAIARSYLKLGDPEKAREIYVEEEGLRNQFSAAFASRLDIRSERAGLEEKLGDVCLDLNDLTGARDHYDQSLVLREAISHDRPDEALAKRDIYLSIRKLGTVDLFQGKPKDARSNYEKVLTEYQRRLKLEPDSLMAKSDVANTLYGVATACLRLGELKAADENYRACLKIRESYVVDERLKLTSIDLMMSQARCGLYQEASAIAGRLCEVPPTDSRIYYHAACGFALSAGVVAKLPASPEHEKLAKRYAEEAVKALRLAKGAGWKNLGDLLNDPNLDPIRDDPGFIAVLREFQEKSAR